MTLHYMTTRWLFIRPLSKLCIRRLPTRQHTIKGLSIRHLLINRSPSNISSQVTPHQKTSHEMTPQLVSPPPNDSSSENSTRVVFTGQLATLQSLTKLPSYSSTQSGCWRLQPIDLHNHNTLAGLVYFEFLYCTFHVVIWGSIKALKSIGGFIFLKIQPVIFL